LSDAPTLDADAIEAIRTQYIRDKRTEASPGPFESISRYNDVYKKNFVSDDDLQLVCNQVWTRRESELQHLFDDQYNDYFNTRIQLGDDDATADAKATTFATDRQNDALYDYIKREVWTRMLNDPKCYSTLYETGLGGGQLAKNMKDEIDAAASNGEVHFVALRRY